MMMMEPGIRLEKVIPAHSGLARNPGRHDENLGTGCGLVIDTPYHLRVEALHGSTFPLVERLSLWDPVCHVDQHDLSRQFPLGQSLRTSGSDISGTHDRNLPHSRLVR